MLLGLVGACVQQEALVRPSSIVMPSASAPTDGAYFRWTGATEGVVVGTCGVDNPTASAQTVVVRSGIQVGDTSAFDGGSVEVTLASGAHRDVTFGFRLPQFAYGDWEREACAPDTACLDVGGYAFHLVCGRVPVGTRTGLGSTIRPEGADWTATGATRDTARFVVTRDSRVGVAEVARLPTEDPHTAETFAKAMAELVLPATDLTLPTAPARFRHAFSEVASQPLAWTQLPDRSDGARRWVSSRRVPAYSTLAEQLLGATATAGWPQEPVDSVTARVGVSVWPCADHSLIVAVAELQVDLQLVRSSTEGTLVDDAIGWTDAQPGFAHRVGCDAVDLSSLGPAPQ